MQNALRIGMKVALGFLLAATFGQASASDAKLKELTPDQVSSMMQSGKAQVFDNNTDQVFMEGHVPGARHVPYDEKLTAQMLPQDKATPVIFYCKNTQCMACHHAAHRATELGYTNVAIMPVGIEGWVKAGKPVDKGNG